MKDDPVVARVRKARHEISARFGHDPKRLVAYYMELQKQHSDRLVGASDSNAVQSRVAEERGEYE